MDDGNERRYDVDGSAATIATGTARWPAAVAKVSCAAAGCIFLQHWSGVLRPAQLRRAFAQHDMAFAPPRTSARSLAELMPISTTIVAMVFTSGRTTPILAPIDGEVNVRSSTRGRFAAARHDSRNRAKIPRTVRTYRAMRTWRMSEP